MYLEGRQHDLVVWADDPKAGEGVVQRFLELERDHPLAPSVGHADAAVVRMQQRGKQRPKKREKQKKPTEVSGQGNPA